MGKSILVVLSFLLFLGASDASAYRSSSGGGGGGGSRVAREELIPVEFSVKRIGKIDIEIVFRKDRAFLPIMTIFEFLRIKADYVPVQNTVSGFYPDANHPYEINLATGSAKTRDTSLSLSIEDYAFSEDEVYLREDLYQAIFGLAMRYESRRLRVSLTPPSTLPIYAMKIRERARGRALERRKEIEPDLYLSRKPAIAELGKINWTLSSRTAREVVPQHSYALRSGGKLIGGDYDFNIKGYVGKKVRKNDLRGVLHYPFIDNKYIGDIRIGDVAPTGLFSRRILGVEVTNRPPGRRLLLSDLQIDQSLPPNSEIEFYDRGKLVTFIRTDAESTFQFAAPLVYGTGDFEIRKYDQWGQLDRQVFRSVIPQTMVPPGDFQYSLIGGQMRGTNVGYGNLSLAQGFTPSLTLTSGAELFEEGIARRQFYPWAGGTIRLMSSLVGEVVVSPLSTSRATLDLQFPSQAQVFLSHLVYGKDVFLNPGQILTATSLSFFAPTQLNSTRISLSGLFTNTQTTYTHQRSFFTTFNIRWTNVQMIYNATYTNTEGSLQPTITTLNSRFDLSVLAPSQIVFRTGFMYEHRGNGLRYVQVGAERLLFQNFFLQVVFERNFRPSVSTAFLRINYNLPFARIFSTASRSSAERAGETVSFTNTIRGSILGSTSSGDVIFSSSHRNDRGALLFRPFIDANGNNTFDDGEEVAAKSRVTTRTLYLTSLPSMGSAGTIVSNVEPYQNYIAQIETRFLDNPLWVPRFNAVSITAEPNILKTYDFPIVVGGNIRGQVISRTETGSEPLSGMTVLLRPVGESAIDGLTQKAFRITKTFSTGEFEFVGVAPGTYEVALDQSEISSLGYTTTTMSREARVAAKPDGDFVEGLLFELLSR